MNLLTETGEKRRITGSITGIISRSVGLFGLSAGIPDQLTGSAAVFGGVKIRNPLGGMPPMKKQVRSNFDSFPLSETWKLFGPGAPSIDYPRPYIGLRNRQRAQPFR